MTSVEQQLNWLPKPITITIADEAANYLQKAYEHSHQSADPSTKNGAVLVSNGGKIIAYGVNKFPPGVAETRSRLNDRKTKYRMVVHAEESAILNAAKHGNRTNYATLYCPFFSCSECSKAIIQAGITKVVGHAQFMAHASTHETWIKSIQDGWNMMQEAGIECCLYVGDLGLVARLNQQDIQV